MHHSIAVPTPLTKVTKNCIDNDLIILSISHLTHHNFYFVEETASHLIRFEYQKGGGVFEDRSSGKGDEQDGGQAGFRATTGTRVGAW